MAVGDVIKQYEDGHKIVEGELENNPGHVVYALISPTGRHLISDESLEQITKIGDNPIWKQRLDNTGVITA